MNSVFSRSQDSTDIKEALSTFDKSMIRRYQREIAKPNLDHLPGDRGMPFLGHIYWFVANSRKWLNQQYNKHGPVFKFKALNEEILFMLGPEANRLLLQNENKIFSNFLAYGPTIERLLDDNVLALDFDHHKAVRKILQAAFKRDAIEGHINLMNPIIGEGIHRWPVDRTIRSTDYIRKLLLDTGAKVFLGLDMGREANMMNKAFVDLVAGGANFIRTEKIPMSPYAKALKARQAMDNFVYSNIRQRRTAREQGHDIFSQLCNAKDENGNYFSDEEICNQVIFVLFAAHDTTASALSSTFYALASNKAWQEELRQEMLNLEKKHLEFEDFDRLQKTGWTIQEALRMYPPVPFLPRYSLKDFDFAGYRIPANTRIFGNAPFSHYMGEYWTNPYRFDPLRFSPDRAEDKKDFFQYVPFGGGAHKCLGLHFSQIQGKMVMFNLLKHYRIQKHPKMTKYKYNNWPLTFPTDGLPLKFTKI